MLRFRSPALPTAGNFNHWGSAKAVSNLAITTRVYAGSPPRQGPQTGALIVFISVGFTANSVPVLGRGINSVISSSRSGSNRSDSCVFREKLAVERHFLEKIICGGS